MDRQGEGRSSIRCKECKDEFCNQCAGETIDICTMMKSMGKSFWTCKGCEGKAADLKSVVNSISSIKTELNTLKKGQEKQQTERAEQQAERADHKAERAKVLEGLKAVETVARRMEKVEEQCNAVAKEVREMERREKNVVIFNVPEPKEGEEDETKAENSEKIRKIFQELGLEGIQPVEARRFGKTGKYPRKILATLRTREECEKTVKGSRESPALANGVFLTPDRTFNERQEDKLFRLEKEKEEEGTAQPERGRGRGRGRPRGRGNFGRGRGSRAAGSESRKRRNSREDANDNDDDESKRRRTGNQEGLDGGAVGGGEDPTGAKNITPDIATPRSVPDSQLGAVGGAAVDEFF